MSDKSNFGLDHPAFAELQKAQSIFVDAIDKTARKNLEATEKMLELNRKRFESLQDVSDADDYAAKQTEAFKEYAEHMKAHVEALTSIGNESREQLTAAGTELAKSMDFSDLFPFGEAASKSKSKPKTASKSS